MDEGRSFLPVRDNVRQKAFPFVLRAAALVWYRGHAHKFSTWELAKAAFRRHYGDPDYQLALREEITNRTQAEGERVREFIACMRGLFSRPSPPWSDWEQVRYAHRNMLSEYRLGLPLNERTKMDGLELAAWRHERILPTATVRRPPPRPEHSLCLSFAHRGSSGAFRPNRRPFLKVQRADEGSDARAATGRKPITWSTWMRS